MKCIAIIPIKKSLLELNENFKLVGKKRLFQYFIEKVKKCGFDEIYVDSDC